MMPESKKDIANKQIDYDVYDFVKPLVNPLPLTRSDTPPKKNPNYELI